MIKNKRLSCTNLKESLLRWWLLQTRAAGWIGTSQSKQGRDSQLCSSPTSKSYDFNVHKTTLSKFPKAGDRHFRTFCFYFSIAFLFTTNTEDGDTPLALIHPKPHGSSIFLTIFIDILMGPPLLNTRTKKLLISLCDRWTEVCYNQPFQIHFHFYMTAYVVVIYWEWSCRLLANFTATFFFIIITSWPNS